MFKTLSKLRFKSRVRKKNKPSKGENSDDFEKADSGSRGENFCKTADSDDYSSDGSLVLAPDTFEKPAASTASIIDKDQDATPFKKPVNTDIKASDLLDVFKAKHADEDRLFREQFQNLAKYIKTQERNFKFAQAAVNREKNRYKNIVTCDESRVTLKPQPGVVGSEYINASFISGYKHPKKFIATQGPKENTINDFWRMMWEYKCHVIVMVTELREVGKKKCDQYWPDKGKATYGDIVVELEAVYAYGGFTKRSLIVTHSKTKDPPLSVNQFQYRVWPDHGVPKTTSEMFRFRLRSLESQPDSSSAGPVVVHCSAGVGRTGTYIALDYLLEQLKSESKVDVGALIMDMRMKRTDMVQSLDQYVFLHKMITEHHLFGATDLLAKQFNTVYDKLKKVDPNTKASGFDIQFKLLSLSQPLNKRFGPGKLPINQNKIRDEQVISYEHSKVFMRCLPTEKDPPFFNASTLQTYDVSSHLIASQDPFSDTLADFWRVITDNSVTCIVMLSPPRATADDESDSEELDTCPQYWPSAGTKTYGPTKVIMQSSYNQTYFTETKFAVSDEQGIKEIVQLRCHDWYEDDNPSEDVMISLLEITEFVCNHFKVKEVTNKVTALVHCTDGASRTGVLCTLINIRERLRRENRVDVFRAVKDLRDCRPLMVRTKKQYRLCYDLVHDMINQTDRRSRVSEYSDESSLYDDDSD